MFKAEQLPEWVYLKGSEARGMALKLWYDAMQQPTINGPDPKPPVRIKVLVPFFNPGSWLDKCVESLVVQDTQDFEVIFVDDASWDATADFYPPASLNAQLIRNEERRGLAYNLQHVLLNYCEPDEVIICLDGDDRLARCDAISKVRQHYQTYDCWVLYSQYRESDGAIGVSAPFASPTDFLSLRKEWRTSHLRTFRAGLFQCIVDQDASLSCLKDDDAAWLTTAVDAALMYPLLEMAGFHRVHFLEEILYIYNTSNQYSHHYQRPDQQVEAFEKVRARRPFSPINTYHPQAVEPINFS
jgi:glycosyltransferase involved in cell wall biosynthesis